MGAANEIAKGLTRRSAEIAVDALIKLPAQERTEWLDRVGPLLRDEVSAAWRRGDWGRLGFWAARAEKEPRLIESATRWELMVGCTRIKDFSRARRLWGELATQLEGAPKLTQAIEAWLASGGRPAAKLLTDVFATLTPSTPDARLGIEPTRPRRPTQQRPSVVAEVERAVLGCCATEPWSVFASTISTWAAAAPPDLARSIRLEAAPLAVREQLSRTAAKRGDASVPVALLASIVGDERAPSELSGQVLLSFRLLASTLGGEPFSMEAEAQPYCSLAAAAAAYPEHRGIVISLTLKTLFRPEAARSGLRLLERLLSIQPSGPLLAKALRLWGLTRPATPNAPPWAEATLKHLLTQGQPARWLEELSFEDRRETLGMLSALLPLKLSEALLDACWDASSSDLRRDLAESAWGMFDRAKLARISVRAERMAKAGGDDFEPAQFQALVEQMFNEMTHDRELPPEALEVLRRQQHRLVAYSAELLELALAHAESEAAARRLVEQFLDGSKKIVSQVEAIRAAALNDWSALSDHLTTQLLEANADQPALLAQALVAAAHLGAPPVLQVELGEAFSRAQHARPAAPSAEIAAAIRMCKALKITQKRSPRKKGPAKKKQARKQDKPIANKRLPF